MRIALHEIARLAHEVNRAYCEGTGDHSQKPWDEAPRWQKDSAVAGVQGILDGSIKTPEDSHESWMRLKLAEGWKYGEYKDADEKTHPCLVPYDELPEGQKVKDHLFRAVVEALR
jgi:hypothetical protein